LCTHETTFPREENVDTQVLIVGAGPTGLMLANQLGRYGVRTMIIDRHSGPAQQSRAMAVHARTLEIYSKLGIVEQAIAAGRKGVGANMWSNGKHTAHVPIGDMGQGQSPFPYVLMLGQDANELIMGEKLRDWGYAVQWNTELISLEQHAAYVTARLRMPDGSAKVIKAAYVAGCDGSRSVVREQCHIAFPGAAYEHVFFVADTVAHGPMIQDQLNVYLWKDGFHLFFPMAGENRWRVIGILPKAFRGRTDLRFEELVPSIAREAGAGLSFSACDWFSTYRIHHRAVERFREGRCFLLGDAAHVHSPMGGQGMNTGLQDAYNLGWKLALVVSGKADDSLLDTYESERLPVAQALLNSTDRAFTLVVSDNWLAGLWRTRIMAKVLSFAMKRPRVRFRAFQALSQIGIHYPRSRLSVSSPGLAKDAPKPGDRFPWMNLRFAGQGEREDVFQRLDDTRFNLVMIGQTCPAELSVELRSCLRTHIIPLEPANAQALARAGIREPSFFLLRPDGHIGLAGTQLDARQVRGYLADVVGLTVDSEGLPAAA
jgi:2-polyprenyl-6-methoxyphenol hydroxylase-like FAD-dependent oxidoreductase